MTHTHIPGPWHIGKRAADVAIYGPKGEEVAEILGFFNDDDENKANARLISAAPDLLGAAQLLLSQYDSSTDFTMGGDLTNEPFLMAREAIAKAIGRGEG